MLCEKECTNIVDFSEHMETVHKNEENLSCNECGQNITVLDMETWCSCHLEEVIHLHSGNMSYLKDLNHLQIVLKKFWYQLTF